MSTRIGEHAGEAPATGAIPAAVASVHEEAAGVREVSERMAQIGLSPKTGWYTSIALSAIGGIPVMMMHLLDPEHFNFSIFLLGAAATAFSLFSVIGLKYFPNSHRATHFRLCYAFTLFILGALVGGEARQVFLMLPLISALPPAIYYGVRDAVPYLIAFALYTWFTASTLSAPWATAMAICATLTAVTLSLSMMIAQGRTRALSRRHRELAFIDPLTGLANTRALNAALERHLATANGRDRLALFAIDLDNFKQVNDRFDHALGDEVLKGVADALSCHGRPGELFARRGGDEFSMVITAPADRDLDAVAAGLADAITDVRGRLCPEVSPSASVAYVRARADDTPGSILQRADDALHAAKAEFHRDDGPAKSVRLALIDQRSESARAANEVMSGDSQPKRRSGDWDPESESQAAGRDSKQIDRPIWMFAAAMITVIGVAVGMSAWLGHVEPLTSLTGGLLSACLLAVAAGSAIAGLRPLSRELIHVSFGLTLLLLSVVVARAGAAGTAFLDLYAVVALFSFHLFSPRVAARYLVACIAVYLAFVIAGSYPFGVARLVVFMMMMLAGAALTAKVRSITSRFIRENQQLSQVDGLTGIANIRALRSSVDKAVTGARAGEDRPVLIAIDLDEFKQVNDSFSHTVGDQVLIAVARAIVENVRSEDIVARRGGDEFVVVTETGEPEELERITGRLREAIARVRGRICPQLVSSASVAVALWEDGDDADALMRRADRALHGEKLRFRESRPASSA